MPAPYTGDTSFGLIASAPPPPAYLKDARGELRHGLPTNFTQTKAGLLAIPDLMTFLDGSRVLTPEDWPRRRSEVLSLLADYQFGRTPASDRIHVATDVTDTGTLAYNGAAKRIQAVLAFTAPQVPEVVRTIHVTLYLPAKTAKPAPVLLMLHFSPAILAFDDPGVAEVDGWTSGPDGPKRVPARKARSYGFVDVPAYLARGVGIAHVYYREIEPDFSGAAPKGVRALFETTPETMRQPGQWGAIGAWAWGVSRTVDFLQTQPGVDKSRIALQGHSRLGKTALWAAAQDERIAAVIDSCSGAGGQSLIRRNYGETLAHLASPVAFSYWFAPRYLSYASHVADLPVDAHMLIAAIAPRPVLLINGQTDNWADPYGAFLAARAASPAWELLGRQGLGRTAPVPPLDAPTQGDLSFFVHAGGHGSAPTDLPVMLDFLTSAFD